MSESTLHPAFYVPQKSPKKAFTQIQHQAFSYSSVHRFADSNPVPITVDLYKTKLDWTLQKLSKRDDASHSNSENVYSGCLLSFRLIDITLFPCILSKYYYPYAFAYITVTLVHWINFSFRIATLQSIPYLPLFVSANITPHRGAGIRSTP